MANICAVENGAGSGDRTRITSLEGYGSHAFLRKLRRLPWAHRRNEAGFETEHGLSLPQFYRSHKFGPQTVVAHREALTKAKGKFTMAGSRSSVSWVYFIQAGEDGPIKIGVTAEPGDRLRILQSGHYEELRLLCAPYCGARGDTIEKRLHRGLSAYHIRGEWFRPARRVLVTVNAILEGRKTVLTDGMDGAILRSIPGRPLAIEPYARLSSEDTPA